MQPNQQTVQLIIRTVEAFNGDVQAISSTDGISLIDNWISALHSVDASTNPIASTLNELKMELTRDNPDSETIRDILHQLSTQAQNAGATAEGSSQSSLNELSQALQSFSQLLGGTGRVRTGGQAPMTSITGGESTAGA